MFAAILSLDPSVSQKPDLEGWKPLSANTSAGGCNNGECPEFRSLTHLFQSIKYCAKQRNLPKASQIHCHVIKAALLDRDMYVGTALLHMYAECGDLVKAQIVFDELPVWDVASCNALIVGYVRQEFGAEALLCFAKMQEDGIRPDAITFSCILKACGSLGCIEKGERVHAEVSRQDNYKSDLVLGTAVMDMYAKCGALAKAQEVFDRLPRRDVTSWTALMTGYADHGLFEAVVDCFSKMKEDGLSPDAITYACVLKALGNLGACERGEEIHIEIKKKRLLERSKLLGNAVIDLYTKCGAFKQAWEVLNGLPMRDVASWTTLIAGYVQHELHAEALTCSDYMQKDGFSPNAVTYACLVKACGRLGAIEKGVKIHREINQQRLLNNNILLGNALVDMFVNCGMLAKAVEVLEELPRRNVASWTALISGYAHLGSFNEVFSAFKGMLRERIEPDLITFVALLNACSHAGLVVEGEAYFVTMRSFYNIIPDLEHYICMIDLFSSAGQLDKAMSMIEIVPPYDCYLLWLALLGACQKWANVDLGRWAFQHAVALDLDHDVAYMCMSNLHAGTCIKEDSVS